MTNILVILTKIDVIKKEGTMPLTNHLKEYRAKLGLNQAQFGKLAGTSRQTISQIERGDYSPSVTLALKLAKVCACKVEDLFEYEEGEDSHEK
jgi:putative transcriptional regulator